MQVSAYHQRNIKHTIYNNWWADTCFLQYCLCLVTSMCFCGGLERCLLTRIPIRYIKSDIPWSWWQIIPLKHHTSHLICYLNSDLPSVVIPDIPLPSILEGIPEAKLKIKNQMALPPTSKPKRNVRHRKASLKQSSYEEERMRQELAERRRKKQQFLLERLKMKTYPQPREECTQIEKDSGPRFEDCEWRQIVNMYKIITC